MDPDFLFYIYFKPGFSLTQCCEGTTRETSEITLLPIPFVVNCPLKKYNLPNNFYDQEKDEKKDDSHNA